MVLPGWTVDKEAARGEETPERTVKLFRAGREGGSGGGGGGHSQNHLNCQEQYVRMMSSG